MSVLKKKLLTLSNCNTRNRRTAKKWRLSNEGLVVIICLTKRTNLSNFNLRKFSKSQVKLQIFI